MIYPPSNTFEEIAKTFNLKGSGRFTPEIIATWDQQLSAAFSRLSLSASNTDEFNIRDFGAVGDNIIDDTVAIQAAVDAAGAAGGVVIIPSGNYKVTSSIIVASGVTVQGRGANSILTSSAMVGQAVISVANESHVIIRGFKITGVHAFAVLIGVCQYVDVTDMDISGGTDLMSYNYGGGIFAFGSDDISIQRNQCYNNGNHANTGSLTSDIQINGLNFAISSQRISILDNVCTSTDVHYNIQCYNLQESVIQKNTATGAFCRTPAQNTGYGIIVYAMGGASPGAVRDNFIGENFIHDTEGMGIYSQNGDNTLIKDNYCLRNSTVMPEGTLPAAGIAVNNGSGVMVINNRIIDCTRSAITTANLSGSGLIEGNYIRNAGGVGGIILSTPTDGLRVIGNDIEGCVSTGIGSNNPAWTQTAVTVESNRVVDCGGHGILLHSPYKCIVEANTVLLLGAHGIHLLAGGSESIVTGNIVLDSSQSTGGTPTYSNIYIQSYHSTVSDNRTGNTLADGAGYGILFDPGTEVGSVAIGNTAFDNRTADFGFPSGLVNIGNIDTLATGLTSFGSRIQLIGQGNASTQVDLGTIALTGALGTVYSYGYTFEANNARQDDTTPSTWHQTNAGDESTLVVQKGFGGAGLEVYVAAAGTADGNFATFWGAPILVLDNVGVLSINNLSLLATGAAPTVGSVTLVAGTAVVSTTAISATSQIFFQMKTAGGTPGAYLTYTQINGTSFTVTSSNVLDTSTYNWALMESH